MVLYPLCDHLFKNFNCKCLDVNLEAFINTLLVCNFSDFKFILENDHVIGDDQVYASVIPFGPSHLPLNSSFSSRSSTSYQQELGLTILKVAQCVPEGLLVFFPSYQVMDGCIKNWQQCRHNGDCTKE